VSVSRRDLPELAISDYDREYSNRQFFFFAQDSFRWTSRLVLNAGVRYENFGAPRNTGRVPDGLVELGAGGSLPERLASAQLKFASGGDQELYASDANNWAGRLGFSYNLLGNDRTLLRGAYGIFYDRPFDNLWQRLRANSIVLGSFPITASRTEYLTPVAQLLTAFRETRFAQDFPEPTLYQTDLRDAYVHSYFLGVQHPLTDTLTLEVSGLGALGRKLITTDLVNRSFSQPIDPVDFATNPFGRFNPALPDVSYRSNQGNSSYQALAVTARYRGRRSQLHLAYTWSHTIDYQSDPLLGDFFDLSFARFAGGGGGGDQQAAFTRQFDSRSDRASSDFDQRHNLVIYSLWELPALFADSAAGALFRGWQFSQMAAFRSGFPYSVNVPTEISFDGEFLVNNRADVVNPASAETEGQAAGGQLLLNAAAFARPAAGRLGNSGRNAYRGPGLFNIDISVSRSFGLPWLGEAGRLLFRADAFNLFNHANLNNPDSFLTSEDFGVALYGRQGRSSGFPAAIPFSETARQIQLLLRVEF